MKKSLMLALVTLLALSGGAAFAQDNSGSDPSLLQRKAIAQTLAGYGMASLCGSTWDFYAYLGSGCAIQRNWVRRDTFTDPAHCAQIYVNGSYDGSWSISMEGKVAGADVNGGYGSFSSSAEMMSKTHDLQGVRSMMEQIATRNGGGIRNSGPRAINCRVGGDPVGDAMGD